MNLVDQVTSSGSGAANQVGMSAEVLCAGVQHDIDAEFCRTLVDRRSESAVDQRYELMLPGKRNQLWQINHSQCRIRGRLKIQQLGIRTNCTRVLVVYSGVHKCGFHAQLRQPSGEKFRDSAIDIALGDDVITTLH